MKPNVNRIHVQGKKQVEIRYINWMKLKFEFPMNASIHTWTKLNTVRVYFWIRDKFLPWKLVQLGNDAYKPHPNTVLPHQTNE